MLSPAPSSSIAWLACADDRASGIEAVDRAGLYEVIVDWADSAEKEISSSDDTQARGKDADRYRQMYETLLVDRRER